MGWLSRIKKVAKAPLRVARAVAKAPVRVVKTAARISPPALLARAAVGMVRKPAPRKPAPIRRAPVRATTIGRPSIPVVGRPPVPTYGQPPVPGAQVAETIRSYTAQATGESAPPAPRVSAEQTASVFSTAGRAQLPPSPSMEDDMEAYAPGEDDGAMNDDYPGNPNDEDSDEYAERAPIDGVSYLMALGEDPENIGGFMDDLKTVAAGFGKDTLVSVANRGAELVTKQMKGPSKIALIPTVEKGFKITTPVILAGAGATVLLLYLLTRKKASTPSPSAT
jgi:hypothetical protein